MDYIDIHCHLDFPDYDADREDVLARMRYKKVGAITIGADLESSKRAVEIAEQNENVWCCIGVHPESTSPPAPLLAKERGIGEEPPSPESRRGGQGGEVGELEELVKSPKVVGVGECGLDYFRLENEEQKKFQKNLFEKQVQFAIKHDKPLMLHIRDAYDDTLNILKNYPAARGNVHFFAGDTAIAKNFLDMGFTMSFTGVITFTRDYDEVIKYIPQDSIMSETDAPFVAPVPHRGKRNEPAFVAEVVKKMAQIMAKNEEELKKVLVNNCKRVFGCP